ncbi:MAG: ureidoglycolate lyase [Alphaproteobacteria bacterium]
MSARSTNTPDEPPPGTGSADKPPVEVPLVEATPENFTPYGRIERSFDRAEVEIVTWPAQGWRPVDPGTGNEGGVTEGRFEVWWEGDILRGRNTAVGGDYVLGRGADAVVKGARPSVLIRHANYHPDGGQVFFPRNREPFVMPLALPGDDVRPEHFVAFYCDGTFGVNIHPGIWHEAVFPLAEKASFDDKQGRVHARISCDFVDEFGVYLSIPLRRP